jgi:hypothetical protein
MWKCKRRGCQGHSAHLRLRNWHFRNFCNFSFRSFIIFDRFRNIVLWSKNILLWKMGEWYVWLITFWEGSPNRKKSFYVSWIIFIFLFLAQKLCVYVVYGWWIYCICWGWSFIIWGLFGDRSNLSLKSWLSGLKKTQNLLPS